MELKGLDQAARNSRVASLVGLRGRSWAIWVVVVAGLAGVGLRSAPAVGATARTSVSITERGFSPGVVVVPIGTVVTWQNDGSVAHSLSGQVSSPGDLQPGQTFRRRFATPGEYRYLDGHHPDSAGTVVVTAGSGRPPRAHGNAAHHYSARLKLSIDDQWVYYDPQWQSKRGPCNAQVGVGQRVEHLDIRVPNVSYARFASVGLEILHGAARGRFGNSGETVQSQIAGASSAKIKCPNGSTEPTADQAANCYRSFTGKPLRLDLSWSPRATKNRFMFTLGGLAGASSSCGSSNIIGALALVGVNGFVLPLNVIGSQIDYDEGITNSAMPAEVEALRAGRAFTVSRRVELDFTTPCCEGFNPGPGGVWARIANIHSYNASLTISFTPRP